MNWRSCASSARTNAPTTSGWPQVLLFMGCCLLIDSASATDCGVPKSISPLDGLIDESQVKRGDANVVADLAGKRIAVVVSSNAEKQLAWNESLRQAPTGAHRLMLEMTGRRAQWEQAERDAYDPKAIVAGMVAPFVSAAKQVKTMADLAEFRDSGFELAVVLDLNFRCSYELLSFWSGVIETDNEVEIAAYPLSQGFVMGPTIYSRNKLRARYEPGYADADRSREDTVNMRLAAVKDFQTNVSRAYPSSRAAQGAGTDAPARQAQDLKARLQTVEDLRIRGLISATDAEEKRREILKGL